MALKAFEELKENEYVIRRQKVDRRSCPSNTDKLEDLDCIKQFIACGRSFLDAQTKLQSPSFPREGMKDLASTSGLLDRMTSMTVRSKQEQTQQSSNSRSLDRTSPRSRSKPVLAQEQSEQRKDLERADENRTAASFEVSKHDFSSEEDLSPSSEADKKWQRLVEEQMDLSQRLSTLTAVTEQALGVMGHKIRCVEKDKDDLNQEQNTLRFENCSMRNAQETGHQLKEEVEALQTGHDAKISDLHQLLLSLQNEIRKIKEEVESLKKVEESLKLDKQSMKEMSDLVTRNADARKELQALKKDQEEAYRSLLLEGEKENVGLTDRIKRLSQLYLKGLQDVRSEVLSLKALSESRVDS